MSGAVPYQLLEGGGAALERRQGSIGGPNLQDGRPQLPIRHTDAMLRGTLLPGPHSGSCCAASPAAMPVGGIIMQLEPRQRLPRTPPAARVLPKRALRQVLGMLWMWQQARLCRGAGAPSAAHLGEDDHGWALAAVRVAPNPHGVHCRAA